MTNKFDLSGSKTLPPLPPPGASGGGSAPAPAAASATLAATKPSPKSAMRFGELNDFVDLTMRSLSHTQLKVWLVLFRDVRNGVARASQKWIAERCGVTDRTVRRVLPYLEARGLVEVKVKGGPGRGPSVYRVRALPPIDADAAVR